MVKVKSMSEYSLFSVCAIFYLCAKSKSLFWTFDIVGENSWVKTKNFEILGWVNSICQIVLQIWCSDVIIDQEQFCLTNPIEFTNFIIPIHNHL